MADLTENATPTIPGILQWITQATRIIKSALLGKLENTFQGTLRASQTTSSFTDPRITINSIVLGWPITANAKATPLHQSATEKGMVTFTHASDGNTDKTFLFVIFGGDKAPLRTAT